MEVIKQIEERIEAEKLNLKIAKAALVLVDAYNNKERYVLKSSRIETKVFSRHDGGLFSCGSLAVSTDDVKHYNEIYKIMFDAPCDHTKELMKALRLLEKHESKSIDLIVSVLNETKRTQKLS